MLRLIAESFLLVKHGPLVFGRGELLAAGFFRQWGGRFDFILEHAKVVLDRRWKRQHVEGDKSLRPKVRRKIFSGFFVDGPSQDIFL